MGYYGCSRSSCPIEASIYEYRPSLIANALFISLFAVSALIHLIQFSIWRSHAIFTAPILLGCVGEIIGYAGRLMLNRDPFSLNGFLIQMCALTIAPALFTAAIYFCMTDIARLFGCEGTSRLDPRQYAWIFIPCDFISLLLQGLGGGIASNAMLKRQNRLAGIDVMVAGLVFQVLSLFVFILLLLELFTKVYRRGYLWKEVNGYEIKAGRVSVGGPACTALGRLYIFFPAFSLAILLIFIRCVYRVAELLHGFNGKLITKEGPFIALEGVMIMVAVFALHFGHPRVLNV
ncbi:parasitic phase-specific protein PSP-1 [Histoplasma capsulatum var. duboisii H88]|uniref:Parasitic phase-specific protein PSP-1 n=1 Tax=Ajellomyces capsulatus (strain H88) TaxID=544711 RepID=F0UTA6_AJEC8|nr:parasitic phase-specific protein PSP-1 [Histoplasma capsulatum var. duboisii H88]QSS54728.1 parasitic phase-specific protein PSP-1 [Histoplasma capsulatum var. duboisii H88]